MKFYITTLLICLAVYGHTQEKSNDRIEIRRIWSEGQHNAFTDLIRYKNHFYCTFREAPGHISGPGGIARVLKSADGKTWRSVADIKMDGLDLRDPKLSMTPDKKLMVLIDVETYKDGKVDTRKPYVSFADKKGEHFSEPVLSPVDHSIASKSDWVWRVTWQNKIGYAINYQLNGDIYLLKTLDGKSFENISKINIDGSPNEATIRFDKSGKMYVLIRREGGDKLAVLATSNAPYTDWTFNKLSERIGGPNFLFLDENTLCITGRQYFKNPQGSAKEYKKYMTSIFITDLEGQIKKIIPIAESGGDTSYAGMLFYKNQLWMSYYSSHEKKTMIYLAKVPLNLLKQ